MHLWQAPVSVTWWLRSTVLTWMKDDPNLRWPPKKWNLCYENIFYYFIHLIHRACEILSTFTKQCHCLHFHSLCLHLPHSHSSKCSKYSCELQLYAYAHKIELWIYVEIKAVGLLTHELTLHTHTVVCVCVCIHDLYSFFYVLKLNHLPQLMWSTLLRVM
jgi:hypothetical protein